jgi:hypothetical protein
LPDEVEVANGRSADITEDHRKLQVGSDDSQDSPADFKPDADLVSELHMPPSRGNELESHSRLLMRPEQKC